MHDSALESFTNFKNTYLDPRKDKSISVVEIGSLAVNSSIKNIVQNDFKYTGVDIIKGENVDIVLNDPYKFPFEDGTIDAITTDHTPQDEENKKVEFNNAKNGIIGLESAFGLLIKNLSPHINISQIIEKIAINPR